jgi:hypothetical protein
MQIHPIDIEPEQIVRWILAEREASPSKFKIVARRTPEVRELPTRKEMRLGDEEHDNLSETATVATLQIAPAHPRDGWLLTVVVEDEIGARIPDEIAMAEEEQEIDVSAFYDEFIRPGRGNANAIAEVEGAKAKARLTRLLENVETNRHVQTRQK